MLLVWFLLVMVVVGDLKEKYLFLICIKLLEILMIFVCVKIIIEKWYVERMLIFINKIFVIVIL